jgi:N-acetylglucosaminyl-diphospho-decaprenol L-rhamnosyltransferase
VSDRNSELATLDGVVAVVINYNAGAHLVAAVASLQAAGVNDVVVVDNGSWDDSLELLAGRFGPPLSGGDPQDGRPDDPRPDQRQEVNVQVIHTGRNLGYGKAANRGAEVANRTRPDWRYLLVCNPDLVVHPPAVARLSQRLEAEADLGVVGPRLSELDGSLYPSARRFPDLVEAMGHGLLGQVAPRNRFTRRYQLLDWDHSEGRDVDWVSGACFLARRSAWEAVGGFDPSFFMYLEDVDLCWRIGQAGWRIGYEPGAEVVHVQGVSADRHPYRMLLAHHVSMWRFAWRTTTGSRRLLLPVVAVGLLGRLGVTIARRRFA